MPEPRTEKTAPREMNAAQAKVDAQIDAILCARNADPFAVLGPQPVATPAGPRWVIRFFDPHAYSATVSGPGIPEQSRSAEAPPRRTIRSNSARNVQRQARSRELPHPVQDPFRRHIRTLRHVRLPLSAERFRFVPDGRRPPLRRLRKARRAHHNGRRRQRREFCRLGAQRAARQRRRRLQSLGRPHQPDARPRLVRHLGTVHPRTRRRRDLQIRNHRPARRHAAAQSRPLRLPRRTAARPPARSSRGSTRTSGPTPTG